MSTPEDDIKEQWRQRQAAAHQEASKAALQAAQQVDPEADMQPRPYYVEGFGFRGTAAAARVYFDVYDSVLLRSISRHKVPCLAFFELDGLEFVRVLAEIVEDLDTKYPLEVSP